MCKHCSNLNYSCQSLTQELSRFCSIMVPLALVRKVVVVDVPLPIPSEPMFFCHEVWNPKSDRILYDSFLFIFMFILPGCFVTISYSRIGCQLWTEGQQLYRKDSQVFSQDVSPIPKAHNILLGSYREHEYPGQPDTPLRRRNTLTPISRPQVSSSDCP